VKETLVAGIDNEVRHTVAPEMSAAHLPVVVLSTPTMVGLIEHACLDAIVPHLDEGETSVGTHVNVSHESAVREGEEFVVRCRLTLLAKRRLTFAVEVDGPQGAVSRGTHERAVVDMARLLGR
jgi:fluoroacetyl-CoA thioesterase